jgi:hypothetical protein
MKSSSRTARQAFVLTAVFIFTILLCSTASAKRADFGAWGGPSIKGSYSSIRIHGPDLKRSFTRISLQELVRASAVKSLLCGKLDPRIATTGGGLEVSEGSAGGAASPVPEPTAAVVFAAGIACVGWQIQRGSRA